MDTKEIIKEIENITNKKNPEFLKKVTNTKLDCFGLYSKDIDFLIKSYKNENVDSFDLNLYYEINFIYFAIKLKQIKHLEEQIDFIIDKANFIDSWAITDSTYQSIEVRSFEDELPFIYRLLNSGKTYAIRYGYLLLFNYKKSEKVMHVPFIFRNSDEYYIQMVEAWLLAELFIFNPDVVYKFFVEADLMYEIKRKAIQKICDSYRVSDEYKEKVKALRKVLKNKM